MNPTIERALGHSPAHKAQFTAALMDIPSSDIRAAAAAVRKVCDTWKIGDFPNPFPRETQGRTEWDKGWAGEVEIENVPPTGTDFSDKKAFPRKDSIVAYVAKTFGADLDSRDFSRAELEAKAAEIEAAA